ncbi:MAG: hypothetical protein LC121_06015 [Anaerolineae bacterium]|nr:hypothetical protein [Anaerolineae bacterium]
MAPAPDEYPDFDSMTPEEQMAWLESLARRQGANADEFLTAADQDIPIPEEAVIDEPGYVPYSISQDSRMERPETEEQRIEAPEDDHDFPPVLEDVEFQADAFETAPAMNDPDNPSETGISDLEEEASDDVLSDADLADPMTWLDGLTARPESADADFLAEIGRAASEPAELDRGWLDQERAFAPQPLRDDRQPELDFDLLEDLDLDGFEELDLDAILGQAVEGAPADAGTFSSQEPPDRWLEDLVTPQEEDTARYEQAAPAGAPEESDLRAVASSADAAGYDSTGAAAVQSEAGWSEEDMLGGADPMTWLETLARRQGANPEELTTEADLEIPELPPDTVVDEPGYTEYSPFGILPPRRDEASRAEPAGFAGDTRAGDELDTEAELDAVSQSLGWLSEMTGEPSGAMGAWLAVEDTFVERELRADDELDELATFDFAGQGEEADALAGMSDDEIEQALLRGELTGEQELAWLRRIAREQAQRYDEAVAAEEAEAASEEVEPAEPGELPPWLQQMRDADAAEDVAALEANAAAWLEEQAEEAPAGAAFDEPALDALGISETDLAAFLEDEIDAEEALEEVGLAEAAPVEMPDWLVETEDESAAGAQLPAWLSEMEQVEDASEEAPDWLSELKEDGGEAERAASEPSAALPPEPDVSAPPREPVIPDSELFASYRQRLAEEPGDYASRLALARTLRAHGEVAPSLDHYETLVENAQLLDDVANDLALLVDEQPTLPRVRRLLGDSLMRRGRLQDALDAYRAALERL